MPKSPLATKIFRSQTTSKRGRSVKEEEDGVAAAELALKADALISDPEILAEMTEGDRMMQEIAATVDLSEAPEDAVSSLVTDLLRYCEREKIDWTQDVMSRAWEHLRRESVYDAQKR